LGYKGDFFGEKKTIRSCSLFCAFDAHAQRQPFLKTLLNFNKLQNHVFRDRKKTGLILKGFSARLRAMRGVFKVIFRVEVGGNASGLCSESALKKT